MKAGLTPVILTVWGSDINVHFSTKADVTLNKMTGQVLTYAKKIIVNSPYMLEQCSRLAGRRIEGEVLPLGVDTMKFRPGLDIARNEWRKKLGINNDAKVFLSIRMSAPQYRHHLVLKAFASAKNVSDDNSYLVFKRYSNKYHSRLYEDQLLRDADNLGIRNFVKIIEEVPYEIMPEIYAFADVIVNYPEYDAFPVSFLEASACEKPVITGRHPSYLGTFAEKYYRMVDLTNIDDLTGAMMEFMNTDLANKNEFSISARNEILQHYDEILCSNRLMEIYHQVILENLPRLLRVFPHFDNPFSIYHQQIISKFMRIVHLMDYYQPWMGYQETYLCPGTS